jgi:hypothetical protein
LLTGLHNLVRSSGALEWVEKERVWDPGIDLYGDLHGSTYKSRHGLLWDPDMDLYGIRAWICVGSGQGFVWDPGMDLYGIRREITESVSSDPVYVPERISVD